MKIRTCAALLLAVLVIPLLAGCSLWILDEKLDAVEDVVEHRVDAVEDAVESAVIQMVTPKPPAPPAAVAATPTESAPKAPAPTETPADALTKEDAEAIALEYVGFTADQVSYLWTEHEIDDGIPQFDVQFQEGYWEYEFEIHAETGKILSFDKDD